MVPRFRPTSLLDLISHLTSPRINISQRASGHDPSTTNVTHPPPLNPHSHTRTLPLPPTMQNYALNDMPAGQQTGMQQPLMMGPPPVAQLPPQMFTTAAQLLDLTDSELSLRTSIEEQRLTPTFTEKLMVALRDGKTLFGVLRSWDQFGKFLLAAWSHTQPSMSVLY